MSESIRTFVALKIPPAVAAAVAEVQRSLKPRFGGGCVRWTRVEHLHLTLSFLGNVPLTDIGLLTERLGSASTSTPPLSLELAGVGCFPDTRNPRVIWVGVRGDVERLKSLQTAVARAGAGISGHEESREFSPHLTIGRVKPGDRRGARAGGTAIEGLPTGVLGGWLATTLHLVRSDLSPEGPAYTDLAVFPLAEAPILPPPPASEVQRPNP